MRGWVAVLTGAAILLSSCAFQAQPVQPAQPVEESQPRELIFQVSDQFDPEVIRQADLFSDQVQRISNGKLTIKVLAQVPDAEELARGSCDLAFLRNIQLAQVEPAFSTFSLPFLYGGQKHMSAALNSDEMLTRLRDKLHASGMRPLAAVYSGGYTLMSDQRVIQLPEDFEYRVVALRTNNTEKLAAFEVLGAKVVPFQQDSLAGLLGTQVENLPSDPRRSTQVVTIDTVEVTLTQATQVPNDSRPLYITSTAHSTTPLWLTINLQTWDSLNSWERAVLSEAQAGLVAGLDDYFLLRDQQAYATLSAQGAVFAPLEREMIADLVYNRTEAFRLPEYFDYKFYDLIQSYTQ